MARGGAIKGEVSPPLVAYPVDTWVCSKCGNPVVIALTPNALAKGEFKHLCGGYYRPEPGREATP